MTSVYISCFIFFTIPDERIAINIYCYIIVIVVNSYMVAQALPHFFLVTDFQEFKVLFLSKKFDIARTLFFLLSLFAINICKYSTILSVFVIVLEPFEIK